MSLPPDYHLHTPLCRHAAGEPVDLAAQALKKGLGEIGFSDHNPMPQNDFDDWRMTDDQLDAYVGKVEEARCAHPELVIKLGLEVDYMPQYEPWIRNLATRYPWDYFIGSVHYVTHPWAIDNPHQKNEWQKRDPYEIWSGYFERLTQAVESGLFDVIGHADLCKKFAIYPRQDCRPMFERLLDAARRHGVAIELNTAGLRKDCQEIYPSPSLLKLAAQMEVPITFGSDAHAPEEVAMNFAEAVQLARSAGYTHFCCFTRRKRDLKPI